MWNRHVFEDWGPSACRKGEGVVEQLPLNKNSLVEKRALHCVEYCVLIAGDCPASGESCPSLSPQTQKGQVHQRFPSHPQEQQHLSALCPPGVHSHSRLLDLGLSMKESFFPDECGSEFQASLPSGLALTEIERSFRVLAALRRGDALRNSGGDGLGQMSLEFYQKKKSRWPFSDECIPWEVWTVKVHVVALATEQERQICREKVGEKLCEKIINIVEVMNRHEYLPKMPTQSEVDNVFDTGLRDVQPYLYKISFQITDALGTSVTTTMRRLIKDTLAL
ncbi:hypothetical protein H8959_015720 [Pygathrix nigripes]